MAKAKAGTSSTTTQLFLSRWTHKCLSVSRKVLEGWYRGKKIPIRVIQRFARQVAERFQPDKIILFGSYAYGTAHDDSDVDILVVMPARNDIDQAIKIRLAIAI